MGQFTKRIFANIFFFSFKYFVHQVCVSITSASPAWVKSRLWLNLAMSVSKCRITQKTKNSLSYSFVTTNSAATSDNPLCYSNIWASVKERMTSWPLSVKEKHTSCQLPSWQQIPSQVPPVLTTLLVHRAVCTQNPAITASASRTIPSPILLLWIHTLPLVVIPSQFLPHTAILGRVLVIHTLAQVITMPTQAQAQVIVAAQVLSIGDRSTHCKVELCPSTLCWWPMRGTR